jgi:hypothetical protein
VDGHRWWIVYRSGEGFQPAYALIQEATGGDVLDVASELDEERLSDFIHDDIVLMRVSANWAEDQMPDPQPGLADFVEAWDSYGGHDVDALLDEWRAKLGVK